MDNLYGYLKFVLQLGLNTFSFEGEDTSREDDIDTSQDSGGSTSSRLLTRMMRRVIREDSLRSHFEEAGEWGKECYSFCPWCMHASYMLGVCIEVMCKLTISLLILGMAMH